MIKNYSRLLILFGWIFSVGCANKVAPGGGPKDATAPVILFSSPENNSVNFSGNQIIISFDEYVQLNDLNAQLVISPPVNPKPQIELRKKSVIIDFDAPLKENTTYTINFGNAIVDAHEQNPLPGFRYVFSTGTEIDSLSISGTTTDALTKKPIAKATVILYDVMVSDTSVLKGAPDYFTRSDENGTFILQNLKPGKYKIYAIKEENNNYIFDSEEEKLGFIPGEIEAGSQTKYKILLFNQYADKINIKESKQPLPGKLITVFNRPVEQPSWLFYGDSLQNTQMVINATGDTITIYGTAASNNPESLSIIWLENKLVIDTVNYQLPRKSNTSIKDEKRAGYNSNPVSGSRLNAGSNPIITWDLPLTDCDYTKMHLLKDSVEVPAEFTFLDSLKTQLAISYLWSKGDYRFMVLPDAVTDRNGAKNDSVIISFFIPDEATKGTISYKVNPPFSNEYFLQLVNDKDEIIRQASKNELNTGVFNLLDPGTYYLRVVKDENNNQRWDRGNYLTNVLPEQVNYNTNPISVRANWEVEVEWETNK